MISPSRHEKPRWNCQPSQVTTLPSTLQLGPSGCRAASSMRRFALLVGQLSDWQGLWLGRNSVHPPARVSQAAAAAAAAAGSQSARPHLHHVQRLEGGAPGAVHQEAVEVGVLGTERKEAATKGAQL